MYAWPPSEGEEPPEEAHWGDSASDETSGDSGSDQQGAHQSQAEGGGAAVAATRRPDPEARQVVWDASESEDGTAVLSRRRPGAAVLSRYLKVKTEKPQFPQRGIPGMVYRNVKGGRVKSGLDRRHRDQ